MPSHPSFPAGGSRETDYSQVLGVRFFAGGAQRAVATGLRGGLVLAPAGPDLPAVASDPAYREALTGADLVLADSGLMVLLWRLIQRERFPRVSGLRYFEGLSQAPALRREGAALWVLPNETARTRTLAWLQKIGVPATEADCYVAPRYRAPAADPALLALARARRPAHIIVGIGGGTQETLGLYLKRGLAGDGRQPGIHCVGAAVAFLTGDQAPIPGWADRFYLGWLLRLLRNPRKLLPRLVKGWRLPWMIWRHGRALPPLKKSRAPAKTLRDGAAAG